MLVLDCPALPEGDLIVEVTGAVFLECVQVGQGEPELDACKVLGPDGS